MTAVLQTSPEFPPFAHVPMTPAARRSVLLREIDVIIDVGANEGQYARWARSLGYTGRIVSFEPTAKPFAALSKAAANDPGWECHRLALGPDDVEIDLHLSQDTICSSVFETTEEHVTLWPGAKQAAIERVPMRTLASLWESLGCDGARVYLKIDAEGFELAVLDGAHGCLSQDALVELEIAVTRHYQGSPRLHEVLPYMTERGFSIVAIEQSNGDDHTTGQMLMVEGIFAGPTHPIHRKAAP